VTAGFDPLMHLYVTVMSFKLLDIINSISCFQLAIFSLILIHKSWKNISNLILTLFFLSQLLVIGIYLLSGIYARGYPININLYISTLPFWFLFGPLMNFYIKSLIRKNFKLQLVDTIHLLPFIAGLLFILFQYYLLDAEIKQYRRVSGLIFRQLTLASMLQSVQVIVYNLFSLRILFQYQKQLKDFCSKFEKRNLIWLKIVLYGYLVPCVLFEVNSFVGGLLPISLENQSLISFTSFLIFFNILYYKAMLDPYVIVQPRELPKYRTSNLDEKDVKAYSKIIEEFVNSKKTYLNPTLTLSGLSESIGIPEKYISQVINQHWEQNFYTYINLHRIEEAKKLLRSKDSAKNTMFGIACDSGFNSKTVFYEAFKKYVGMTPTAFRDLGK
jgi:AraC-like DNA-binding protein